MTTGVIAADRKPARRQLEVLEFIARELAGGTSPTIREIGEGVGLASTSAVDRHLASLERCGLIERGPAFVSRGIRITAKACAEYPDLFPPTPAERVTTAALEAQAAGEPLPARVVAALAAVA